MAKRIVAYNTHVKSDFSFLAHFPVLALPQLLNLSLYRKVLLLPLVMKYTGYKGFNNSTAFYNLSIPDM